MKRMRQSTHVDAVAIQYDQNDPGRFVNDVFSAAKNLVVEFHGDRSVKVCAPGYSGDTLKHLEWLVVTNNGARFIYYTEKAMSRSGWFELNHDAEEEP